MNVTMEEAARNLLELIHTSVPGDEILLMENNLPIAKIVALPKPARKAGSAKDKIIFMVSIGKLTLTQDYPTFLSEELRNNRINVLPIELHHLNRVAALPFLHKDPF